MKKSKLGRTPGLDALTYAVLIAAALVALFPVLWGLFTALKSPAEVNSFPPPCFPTNLLWKIFYPFSFVPASPAICLTP